MNSFGPLSPRDVGECVLFLRPRLLGDVIFTLPALELFASHFPGVRIAYLTEPAFAELAGIFPMVDEVIVMKRRPGLSDLIELRRRVRYLGCRVAVDFHSGPHSAMLTRVSGAIHRIGYRSSNRNWAYTRLTPRHPSGVPKHSVSNQVRLLEHFGIPKRPIPFYPEISVADPESRGSFEMDPRRVVIHVGAGNSFRNWGKENFLVLSRGLVHRGIRVALIGNSRAECETAAGLGERIPLDDWTGKLTLTDSLALIAASGAYIGVDSGPLHLASLTRTPLIALYGPNIPAVSGPWRNHRVTILQTRLTCRPCSQRRCRYDTIRCMQEISPHVVLKAVEIGRAHV